MTATGYTIKVTAVLNGVLVELARDCCAEDPFGEMTGRWVADCIEDVWESLPQWTKDVEQHRQARLTDRGITLDQKSGRLVTTSAFTAGFPHEMRIQRYAVVPDYPRGDTDNLSAPLTH